MVRETLKWIAKGSPSSNATESLPWMEAAILPS